MKIRPVDTHFNVFHAEIDSGSGGLILELKIVRFSALDINAERFSYSLTVRVGHKFHFKASQLDAFCP